jgi:hypothetical protein
MAVLALAVLVLAMASGICAIGVIARRRRTPRELRGDWWTSFEREFRAYAEHVAARDPDRRRHRGERA